MQAWCQRDGDTGLDHPGISLISLIVRLMSSKPAGNLSMDQLCSSVLPQFCPNLSQPFQHQTTGFGKDGNQARAPGSGLVDIAVGRECWRAAHKEVGGRAAGESQERQDNLPVPLSRATGKLCH